MMNKLRNIHSDQRGAASLITVILLAIILSTMTMGLIRLSIQDARQATDSDLTNRAFYAAESGVNDGKRFIEKYLAATPGTYALNGDICALPSLEPSGQLADIDGDGSSDFDIEYTCQLIDLNPVTVNGSIAEEGVFQIPLRYSGPDTPTGVRIRWHSLSASGGDGPVAAFRTDGVKDLPNKSDWNANGTPALFRANIFSTPKLGPFDRLQITNNVLFLNPTTTADIGVSHSGNDGEMIDSECTTIAATFGGFACEIEINIGAFNFTNQDFELRLRPLYRATQFEVSFVGGSSIEFDGVQAQIDVTGRAADVYRRVRASVDLNKSNRNELPDYAVQSANGICKLITIDTIVNHNCPIIN